MSAHLHSLDNTTFRCLDDWTCLAHSSTSLSTKFPEFTVVVIYNSITVFNTCSYLLYTCYNVEYHFTSLPTVPCYKSQSSVVAEQCITKQLS